MLDSIAAIPWTWIGDGTVAQAETVTSGHHLPSLLRLEHLASRLF